LEGARPSREDKSDKESIEMKNVLIATTALAGLALAAPAQAGGFDGFAGSLAGGIAGGLIAGAIAAQAPPHVVYVAPRVAVHHAPPLRVVVVHQPVIVHQPVVIHDAVPVAQALPVAAPAPGPAPAPVVVTVPVTLPVINAANPAPSAPAPTAAPVVVTTASAPAAAPAPTGGAADKIAAACAAHEDWATSHGLCR
jgi:hypothetical protein